MSFLTRVLTLVWRLVMWGHDDAERYQAPRVPDSESCDKVAVMTGPNLQFVLEEVDRLEQNGERLIEIVVTDDAIPGSPLSFPSSAKKGEGKLRELIVHPVDWHRWLADAHHSRVGGPVEVSGIPVMYRP